MEYREKITELIFDQDDDALMNWIQQQPLIEQPDIVREYKEICIELINLKGAEIPEGMFEDLDKKANAYEESILDEQLANLQYELAIKDRDKWLEENEESFNLGKLQLRYEIENNADNIEELIAIAKQIIEVEKNAGIYKAEDWDWFTY